jgi:hypothetical protein
MTEGFFEPLSRSFALLLDLLLRLLVLVAILVVGLVAAWLVRRILVWFLGLLRLEELTRKFGFAGAFSAVRLSRPLPLLVADVCYALVLVTFLIVGLDALDPDSPGAVATSVYGFLPRVLVAFVILMASYVLSVFIGQWTLLAAVNAQWRGARAISGGVQFLVLSLGLSMALEQLGVARGIVTSAFVLSFGGVVLALALAFGIGGAEIARRTLESRIGGGSEASPPDEFSHL